MVKKFILCIENTNELIGIISRLHRLRFHEFCDHIITSRHLFEDANDVFLAENLNTLPQEIMIRLLKTATIQTDKMTEEMIFEKCVIWAKWHAQIQKINHQHVTIPDDDDAEGKMEEPQDVADALDGASSSSVSSGVSDWKQKIKPLLEWIRFPLMSGDYFASKVVNMNILTSDDCGLVMQYLLNRKPNKNLKYSSRRRCLYFAQFKFDVFCDGNDVKQQGHCLQVNPDVNYITMGLDYKVSATSGPPAVRRRLYGYSKPFNSGVHTFTIQCTQVGERYIFIIFISVHLRLLFPLRLHSDRDAIGIMTDVSPCTQESVFFNDKRVPTSFVWAQYGSFFKVVRTSCNEIVQNIPKWKSGDVIAMEVDCSVWVIRCFMNEKLVAEGAIANEKAYYFAVGIRSNAAQYRIIDYRWDRQK